MTPRRGARSRRRRMPGGDVWAEGQPDCARACVAARAESRWRTDPQEERAPARLVPAPEPGDLLAEADQADEDRRVQALGVAPELLGRERLLGCGLQVEQRRRGRDADLGRRDRVHVEDLLLRAIRWVADGRQRRARADTRRGRREQWGGGARLVEPPEQDVELLDLETASCGQRACHLQRRPGRERWREVSTGERRGGGLRRRRRRGGGQRAGAGNGAGGGGRPAGWQRRGRERGSCHRRGRWVCHADCRPRVWEAGSDGR